MDEGGEGGGAKLYSAGPSMDYPRIEMFDGDQHAVADGHRTPFMGPGSFRGQAVASDAIIACSMCVKIAGSETTSCTYLSGCCIRRLMASDLGSSAISLD